MNEYKLQTTLQAGEITVNYEEMDSFIANLEAAYADYEVTEDGIQDAKQNRATLNKIKAEIDTRRKTVKREYEKPVKAFEGEIAKRVQKITAIMDKIDECLKLFEQRRIEARRVEVRAIYDAEIGDLVDYLPYEAVRLTKWDNKTCTDSEIRNSIQELKIQVRNDLDMIATMSGEFEGEVLKAYRTSGNSLNSAMRRLKDLRTAKETAERMERERQEQERRAQETAAEPPRTPVEPPQATPDTFPDIIPEAVTEPPSAPTEVTYVFTFYDEENAKFIRETCDLLDIRYKEG